MYLRNSAGGLGRLFGGFQTLSLLAGLGISTGPTFL